MQSVLKEAVLNKDIDTQASGTGTTTGDALDMSTFGSICFVLALGDCADGAVITLKAQQGSTANLSDAADITGAAVSFTASATSADNKLLILDVKRPLKRYVRCAVVVATAAAVIESAVSLRYSPAAIPVKQGADVVASAYATGA